MSTCTFIASNLPLEEFEPSQDYPFHINLDDGTMDDGGADDNYFLFSFQDVDLYTDKHYGVYLEWDYTDGRAKNILEYIKVALEKTDEIELWRVWLMDYYEYEDRPIIHTSTISIHECTIQDIKEIDCAPIWNHKDDPNRPSYYCLKIVKEYRKEHL